MDNEATVNVQLRELVSYPPQWIIRRGNTIFLLIFLALVAGSCFIYYPETVKGSLKLIPAQGGYYGELILSPTATGKIKKGQVITIQSGKIYGNIKGIVNHVVEKPVVGDSLLAKIDLPAGTRALKDNSIATVQIITGKRMFIEQIFGRIKKLLQ